MAENIIDFDEIDQLPQQQSQEQLEDYHEEEIKSSPVITTQKQQPVKKPQSAFALYLTDVKDQLKQEMQEKNLKHTMFLSEASKRWNALNPVEKQKYNEMAQKQKDAYKA